MEVRVVKGDRFVGSFGKVIKHWERGSYDSQETFYLVRFTNAEQGMFKESDLCFDIFASEEERDIKELAEKLHGAFCKDEHTETCDWFYNDDWNRNRGRKKYYKRAEILLKKFHKKELIDFINMYYETVAGW